MLTYIPAAAYDFGYSWVWTSAHLIPLTLFTLLAVLAWRLQWRRWLPALFAFFALWSLAGFLIVRFIAGLTEPMSLPTAAFLPNPEGRVLDLGAGSGRATLMVALARPRARVIALDKFAEGYGIDGNRPDRLRANLETAGVAARVEIQSADMRQLPFPDASLDAALSAYAMDHLGRDGFRTALAETARVLKPGGQFLFFTINRDIYLKIAYPFLHGGYYGPRPAAERWRDALTASGAFEIAEQGATPASLYFLARKR